MSKVIYVMLVTLNLISANPTKSNLTTVFSKTSFKINSDSNFNAKKAIDFANDIFKGEVIKLEKKYKKDISIWKINMQNDNGSPLEIETSYIDGKLQSLKGDEGPFDYEAEPGMEMNTFTSARKAAEEHSGKKILKWNLLRNKDKWEYNFWVFVKSGKPQIKVDAESGEIIRTKKKR